MAEVSNSFSRLKTDDRRILHKFVFEAGRYLARNGGLEALRAISQKYDVAFEIRKNYVVFDYRSIVALAQYLLAEFKAKEELKKAV